MTSSTEKHAEDAASEQVEYAVGSVEATAMNNLSDRVRKIRRKVDMRLCIIIAVLYTVCQIDRQNLAYAVVAGMGEDIDLGAMNYSIIVLLFFPTYTLFQPIMTVMARKIGPRWFLSGICVAWGVVMLAFGFAHRWQDLAGLRILLGLLEAGFFPSSVFLISTWYVRHEVAIRIAFFYLFGNVFGGFGGVLAYGLQQMDGLAGYEGWRWIFIMEGVVTALLGFVGYIFIVDFPENARQAKRFLTAEEVDIMVSRIDADRGDAHSTEFSLRPYLENALDWKVWILAINFGLTSMVIYAVAYFLPIVLRDGLGFSVVEAQTLNAPCYVFGGILGLTESWLSDKYKLRGPFIMLNSILEIIGLSLLGFHHDNVVRYIGAYFVVGGANACLPLTLTYQSNNIVGQWRRAFCSALIVGMGGIGGIIASLVFRGQDKPGYRLTLLYRPGLYACLAAASLTFISVGFTTVVFRRKNQLQRQGKLVIENTDGFTYTL
ncbi:putative WD repeat-containing protein C12G12.01c [Fusarium oxysporum f. sp. albedinis]|nr:putative WD repeat-containing protein C12G12.01c [Fusarium oxysporum f. sp. albedinis]